jgi:ligand-binding SRPBCC domain-containing protein
MIRNSERVCAYSLEREQTVSGSIEEVFAFFSDPSHMDAITPSWLRFRVLGDSRPSIEAGTTIDYRLWVHDLPLRWKSRIVAWNPPFEFVEEQVKGPYNYWRHHHSFEETEEGVVVRDRIEYSVHDGTLIHGLFACRDLDRIFDQRRGRIASLLGRGSLARAKTTSVF